MTNLDKVHFLYHFTRIPMYRAHEGNFVLNVAPRSFTIRRNAKNKFCEIRYSKRLFSPFFRPVILSSPETIQVSPNLNVRLREVTPPPIDTRDAGAFSDAAVPTSDISGLSKRGDLSSDDFLIPRANVAYRVTISDLSDQTLKPTCMNKNMRIAMRLNNDSKDDEDNRAAMDDLEISSRIESEKRKTMCATDMSGTSTCRLESTAGLPRFRQTTSVQMQPIAPSVVASGVGESFGTERSAADILRTTAEIAARPIDILGSELLGEGEIASSVEGATGGGGGGGGGGGNMDWTSDDEWSDDNIVELLDKMKQNESQLRAININPNDYNVNNLTQNLVDVHVEKYNLSRDITPREFSNHLENLYIEEMRKRGAIPKPRSPLPSTPEIEDWRKRPSTNWSPEQYERALNWFKAHSPNLHSIDFDISRLSYDYIEEYILRKGYTVTNRDLTVDEFIEIIEVLLDNALARQKTLETSQLG